MSEENLTSPKQPKELFEALLSNSKPKQKTADETVQEAARKDANLDYALKLAKSMTPEKQNPKKQREQKKNIYSRLVRKKSKVEEILIDETIDSVEQIKDHEEHNKEEKSKYSSDIESGMVDVLLNIEGTLYVIERSYKSFADKCGSQTTSIIQRYLQYILIKASVLQSTRGRSLKLD
jgi:flagellar biosynthesis GTPase FlhF